MVGGGAAGYFCAINAARLLPLVEVTILEKSGKVLSKVKVSGGGRCNVTHSCFSIAEMVKNYPRGANFLKRAFHHFFTSDTIGWFLERGVVLKTEPDGRMFPESNTSETIIDCFEREVAKYEVILRRSIEVVKVGASVSNNKLVITTGSGEVINSDFVCLACGGYPKSSQFNWLQNSGHTILPPVPSLFTFNLPGNPITELMGITVEKVEIKITGTKYSKIGPLLITHWGFSGPAVLKLSAFAAIDLFALGYNYSIVINWIPEFNEQTLQKEMGTFRARLAGQKMINRNPFLLPHRLWSFLINQAGIPADSRWADLPAKQQNLLVKLLCTCRFEVKGKTTFKEEFVTSGGISLDEIDPGTMESKLIPNLFFAGEIMNVDGITGGFNFQHAWTSGWIAAQGIVKRFSS